MKILAIRGSNLASLKGPFELDLEAPPLCHLGLFAIAGPVGAGKSTLLDAMCLALFNRTPRLSGHGGAPVLKDKDALKSNDPRSLVRRGVATAFAEVDLRGVDGRVYRARWQVRRARGQAFGKLQPPELSLVDVATGARIGDGTMDTLASIEDKLGLSFDELCRSMLLAQGSFSSFLRAKPEERAALLEKITGTELYSTLSMRAFGRARVEEAGLMALEEQMRGLAPADAARRSALEESDARAAALCLEHAAILEQAEGRARHAAHARELAESARDAERVRDLAASERAATPAAARVTELAPVWPLRPAWRAFDAARTTSARAVESARFARDEQRVASGLVSSLAERAQRTAAALAERRRAFALAEPLLERALILDEQIARTNVAALVDEHARASAERAALTAAIDDATATRATASASFFRAQEALRAEPALTPLLGVWPTVHALLEQLARIDTQHEGALALSSTAQARRDDAQHELDRTIRELEDAARLDAEAERVVRAAFGGAFDDDAPVTASDAAMALAGMANLVDERARADVRGTQLRRALADRRAEEAAANERERLAEAAHRTSTDELARANAIAARAALVDGEACPVCGSLDHPALGDAPASAPDAAAPDAPVSTREPAHDTRTANASANALDEVIERAREDAAHARTSAEARAAAHARASEAARALEEHESADRKSLEQARSCTVDTLAHARRALDAWRSSKSAHDLARMTADAAAHALQIEAAAHRLHNEALARLHDERHERAASLAQLLGDREAAAIEGPRAALTSLRARVEGLKAHDVAAQHARERVTESERVLRELEVRAAGVAARAEQLAVRAQAALEDHARLTRDRAALFEGEPIAPVRARLVEAVDDARAGDAEATLALAQAQVRAQEAERRRVDRDDEAERTSAALATHEGAFTELAVRAGIDVALVAATAALDDGALDEARDAVRALDDTLARAEAILSERRAALAAHTATASWGESELVDVVSARARLAEAMSARGSCAAALLHDDDVRARAAALLPTLEAQRLRARTWTALADVIGSSDGARFRVFAQSLTLDALLVRANEQLVLLAPRYRLERVPSEDKRPRFDLELVVVDRESGDEPRGVASLSGGETFLVSLALALGLSSLSSSRTPVESLFIDEGFSSLDAETLESALAALEALRATGRQIGVISHVPALVERIGAQVRVVPLGGGRSRIDVRAS